MNCDSKVVSREEAIQYANLQEKEAKIQILNWVLQVMGTGVPIAMVRARIYKMIDQIKESNG
jgi:hypothetical protein